MRHLNLSIRPIARSTLAPLLLICGLATSAIAEVEYEICIRTQDVSEAGTDNAIWAVLYGAGGETGEIELNTDRDDHNRNTWTCHVKSEFQKGMKDVGPINSMKIMMKGDDDVCFRQQYVRRRVDGVETHISQLPGTGCIGDDARSRYFVLRNKKPVYASGPADGFWFDVASGGKSTGIVLERSFTAENRDETTMQTEEKNSISATVEQDTGLIFAGSKVSMTAEYALARTSIATTVKTMSMGEKLSCSTEFANEADKLGVIWQWRSTQQLFDGSTIQIATCHFVCTAKGAPKPAFPLGSSKLSYCYNEG